MTSRRKVLYGLSGTGITTLLFTGWVKPVVNSVLLPAHAETSATVPVEEQSLSDNTPPAGEDISVDMLRSNVVRYDMSRHLSDAETPADELAIAIVSVPDLGTIRLVAPGTFEYELPLNPDEIQNALFTYFVLDPQGAKSSIYTVTIYNLPQPGPL